MKATKQQSAMEYLMTYGWAILIIAVVLIGLNYLGIFNSETFAPKASPGACYVLRTAAEVSLAGECNNYIPRSVGQFNGANSYIDVGSSSVLNLVNSFTISAWIYPRYPPNSDGSYGQVVAKTDSSGNGGYEFGWLGSLPCSATYVTNGPSTLHSTSNICASTWAYIDLTYNGLTSTLYINGQASGSSSSFSYPSSSQDTGIGRAPARTLLPYNGLIADVQIYNTSLSASSIQTMYAEGIGGAPIQLQNLVGWWPLNGDTVDYSGNGDNGANTNVIFNPNWYTSYTPT